MTFWVGDFRKEKSTDLVKIPESFARWREIQIFGSRRELLKDL